METKRVPFTIAKKERERKSVHLIEHVQGLYAENYKILMHEIKDLNKWKDIACS